MFVFQFSLRKAALLSGGLRLILTEAWLSQELKTGSVSSFLQKTPSPIVRGEGHTGRLRGNMNASFTTAATLCGIKKKKKRENRRSQKAVGHLSEL